MTDDSSARLSPVARTVTVNGVPTQAVVFPYRRGRAALLALGSALFVVLGLGCVVGAVAQFYGLTDARSSDVPAALWALSLLLLGTVSVVFFGLTAVAWTAALLGRSYVALTAQALVVRDVVQRAVVAWDDLNVPHVKSVGLQRYIALRFRKRATVPLPRLTRWTRWANRRMGFGDFDLWVPEDAIASAPLLVRAIRWHKQAPRTTESLTLGHRHQWEDPQPRDE